MIVLRLVFSYLQEYLSSSLGHTVKSILRKEALNRLFKLGTQRGESQGDMIHLITDGLEQIDAYVSNYIPQMLYAIITPSRYGDCYYRYNAYYWGHPCWYSTINSAVYDSYW